jgi:GH15 family glucan-1,4-alpha-glucosidase
MRRIEDYALLSDLQTAALVHRSGSIDWCCFPRFDSGACFAALLGDKDNGSWTLAPAEPITGCSRRYRKGTLILESEFETDHGLVRVIDFMPPRGEAPDIVRIVEGVRGIVEMKSLLIVRFDYGHIVPWMRRMDGLRLAIAGPDAVSFQTPVESHGDHLSTVSNFTVTEGERIPFVMTWYPSHKPQPAAVDPEVSLIETESFGTDWCGQYTYEGQYGDVVHRSLLVLKALTYAPSGGIVAAPTTSLPEWLGGVRNWDYRFCWLRDASLTLVAMLKAGYQAEALAWRDWLLRAIAGDPADVQIMYGITGERRLEERELDWLAGFEGSKPVRIGNAASTQVQLDVYGEIMDAMYLTLVHGGEKSSFAWSLMKQLLKWLEHGWRQEDAGIWEVRGPNRHFTHSKIMAWVAFDRAVRMCEEFGQVGPVDRWRDIRDEIHAEVLDKAWSERQHAFAQYYGSDDMDASILLMPIIGFLPPNDPRVMSTVEAVCRELTVDGLLLRYKVEDSGVDGLPPGEGAFLACSFWLVEVLALQRRDAEARVLFERLISFRNDLDLLAEEYDPVQGIQLGNFPQAFTHLALVTAALTLEAPVER